MKRLHSILVAVSCSIGSALAQATPHAATAPERVPIHTQAADEGVEYGVWAGGKRYKASFHDGMTFVPYLGRKYPVARSLRWRTQTNCIDYRGAQRSSTYRARPSSSSFKRCASSDRSAQPYSFLSTSA